MAEPRNRRPAELADALSADGAAAAALGRRLAALGLTERAVCACFAVRCPAHALRRLAHTPHPTPLPPAALLPWLFAIGRAVPRTALAHRLGADLDRLLALGLVEPADGDLIQPRYLLLPAGPSLVVCTGIRPDDSSYHLLGALPARRVDRWLDVGTGNGFLPLAARALAAAVRATDIDDDALALARAGVALSGAAGIDLGRADLLDGAGAAPFPLVTFNAPWPGAEPLLERFYRELPARVAAGGEALIHSVYAPELRPATGQVVAARYTPADSAPAFAVTRWRPGPPQPAQLASVTLTAERPHVTRADLEPPG